MSQDKLDKPLLKIQKQQQTKTNFENVQCP